MTSFYLSCLNNILIEFKSSANFAFDERARLLLAAYVPGASFIVKADRVPDVLIEHTQSKDRKFFQEEGKILISDNWGDELPLDVYHLLYSVVRIELLKRDLFSVHAACIGNGEYILIVGHTGVGKTSIVLELLKDSSTQFFSGNKTVISFGEGGHMEAKAGTSTLTASMEDVKWHAGETAHVIQYGNRAALTLEKKYTNTPGRVRAIVLVSLNDGVSENIIMNPINALHRLYPYFLDIVNADTILCNGGAVYAGIPPVGTRGKLALNLQNALSQTPTHSINGSLEFVCDAIKKI